MTLNTPEDIEAWIAERKKRFPTASRVADKKANLEEAIARGQLPFDHNPRFPKRRRLEEPNHGANRGRGGSRGRRRGNGPSGGRGGVVNSKVPAAPTQVAPGFLPLQPPLPAQHPAPVLPLPEDDDSSDSDGASPEILTTKTMKDVVPELLPPETSRSSEDMQIKPFINEKPTELGRPPARQPRGPPPIPFGHTTPLLRNVRFLCVKCVDCD